MGPQFNFRLLPPVLFSAFGPNSFCGFWAWFFFVGAILGAGDALSPTGPFRGGAVGVILGAGDALSPTGPFRGGAVGVILAAGDALSSTL